MVSLPGVDLRDHRRFAEELDGVPGLLPEQGLSQVGEVRVDAVLGLGVPRAEKGDDLLARLRGERDPRPGPHLGRVDRGRVERPREGELRLEPGGPRRQDLLLLDPRLVLEVLRQVAFRRGYLLLSGVLGDCLLYTSDA